MHGHRSRDNMGFYMDNSSKLATLSMELTQETSNDELSLVMLATNISIWIWTLETSPHNKIEKVAEHGQVWV